MNKRLPLVLLGLGSLVLPVIPKSIAQTPPPSPSSADEAFGQTLTELETMGTDQGKKLTALQKLIDEEVAAKRLSETAAQNLRLGLLGSSSAPGVGYAGTVISNRVPAESTALLNAAKAFETDWGMFQIQRANLTKKATDELRLRILAATRSATTVAEIDPLIAIAERLQRAVPSRNFSSSVLGPNYVAAFPNFLRALRRVVEVQNASPVDTLAIGESLNQLRNVASSSQGAIDDTMIQARTQEVGLSFQKAQDVAQEKLEGLLLGSKPSAEIQSALASFEQAAERCQQVQISGRRRDVSNLTSVYRSMAAAAAALEAGQYPKAKTATGNLRSNLQALGVTKTVAFTRLLDQWNKTADEGVSKATAKRQEELRARLAAIKRPAELEALAVELYKAENEARERDQDFSRGLAGQLSVLAAAWTTSNTALVRQSYYEAGEPRLTSELAELRKRIDRELFVTSLRVPELNQAPLAEKPLDEAIEIYTTQLAQKGEWRRILQIIEPRANQGRMEGAAPRDGDLATALRAFLAGQNMELAEQWADAIQSYKAVLTSTSERAPIKEAAARLKILSTEHPEAAKPPTTPAPLPTGPTIPRTR